MKKFVFLLLLFLSVSPLNLFSKGESEGMTKTNTEIVNLKKNIVKLASDNEKLQEKFYKHKLALQQTKLLILNTTVFIYLYRDGTRNFDDIYNMVSTAYECSFIFKELGYDHIDAFVRILAWAEAESGFNPDIVCHWKANTWLERYGKKIYIKKSSIDYGTWQINDCNLKYIRKLNSLYRRGIITFKIKDVRKMKDVLDVPTNCVARCVIETDRKKIGWSWKHDDATKFINLLNREIYKLRITNLYDRALVQKYYHLEPIKYYTGK